MIEVALRSAAFSAGVLGVLLLFDAKHEYGVGMIFLCFVVRILHVRYAHVLCRPTPPAR